MSNYTPVTDAMLDHPPDGDWLMFRRNYQGWSFSPLKQIDAGQRQKSAAQMGLGDERGRRQ